MSRFQRCLVVVTNWNREILNPIGSSWFPDNLRRGFHFPGAPAKFPIISTTDSIFPLSSVHSQISLLCLLFVNLYNPSCRLILVVQRTPMDYLYCGLIRQRRAVWLALLRHSSHNKHFGCVHCVPSGWAHWAHCKMCRVGTVGRVVLCSQWV